VRFCIAHLGINIDMGYGGLALVLQAGRDWQEDVVAYSPWRREWDSNPRYGFPHTRFPSVRLKPLGHLSGAPSLEGAPTILQGIARKTGEISASHCIHMVKFGAADALIGLQAEPVTGLPRRFS
jgi:hypothetical protein